MGSSVPSIFRVFVPVTDFDKAIAFYQRLFDAEGQLIHGGRRYFYCGPVIFAVIENNGTPACDGHEGRKSVALIEAIYRAARDKQSARDVSPS